MTGAVSPVLGSSCAKAATAAEMRYRIDRPIAGRSGARVIALDPGASAIVQRVARQPWGQAHLVSVAEPTGTPDERGTVLLRDIQGRVSTLAAELEAADVVLLVATTAADAAAAASIIGAACMVRSIMTAGVVIGDDIAADSTVAVLRPHARVLIAGGHEHDISDLLTALRA